MTEGIFIFLIFLLMGVISGSRFEIGGYDYNQYNALFYDLPDNIFTTISGNAPAFAYRMEMGYLIYNSLIKSIISDFNIFLLITGLLTSLGLYFVFNKFSKYVLLSLLIFVSKFYLYYFFTAQRQIIAMVICWLSIHFILKRKLLPFVLLILLASTFHSTAIIFLLSYYLLNIKFNNTQIYIAMLVSGFVGLFGVGSFFIEFAISSLPFTDKIDNYLEIESKATNFLNYIEILPFFYIILKNRVFFEKKYSNFNLFLNFFFISNVILIFFHEFNFISRVSSYFLVGYVFLVPLCLDLIKQKSKTIEIVILLSLCYLAIYIRHILTFSGGTGLYPYKSFF